MRVLALAAVAIFVVITVGQVAAASLATEGAAYADAGAIFFRAAGYSVTSVPVTDRPATVGTVCEELKKVQQDCLAVDGAIQGYTSDAMTFVLSRKQQEWNFISAENQGRLGRLTIAGYEVLCASYLAQELPRTGVPQPRIRELLKPQKHVVLAETSIHWPTVSVIVTDSANITVMKDRENVRCFLVQAEQTDALVAASVTLKR
jgi:hypothetical protein